MRTLSLTLVLVAVAFGCLYDFDLPVEKRNVATRGVHWCYTEEECGPQKWAELDPSYATCATGSHQTPVDVISQSTPSKTVDTTDYFIGDLTLNPASVLNTTVLNNGHTIVVTGSSSNTVTGGPLFADKYNLLQYHFHVPSEHTLNGKQYPLELHLVHQNAAGELAVVGLFFDIGNESQWLAPLFNSLSKVPLAGNTTSIDVNPYSALPTALDYYHYSGSLTTPPCSEGVKWLLLQSVETVSVEQMNQWNAVVGVNNRPIQDLKHRSIFKVTDAPGTTTASKNIGSSSVNGVMAVLAPLAAAAALLFSS